MADNENNSNSNDNITGHMRNASSYLNKENVIAINFDFIPNMFEPESIFNLNRPTVTTTTSDLNCNTDRLEYYYFFHFIT